MAGVGRDWISPLIKQSFANSVSEESSQQGFSGKIQETFCMDEFNVFLCKYILFCFKVVYFLYNWVEQKMAAYLKKKKKWQKI